MLQYKVQFSCSSSVDKLDYFTEVIYDNAHYLSSKGIKGQQHNHLAKEHVLGTENIMYA